MVTSLLAMLLTTQVILLRDVRGERGSGSCFLFGVSLTPHPTSRLVTLEKKTCFGFSPNSQLPNSQFPNSQTPPRPIDDSAFEFQGRSPAPSSEVCFLHDVMYELCCWLHVQTRRAESCGRCLVFSSLHLVWKKGASQWRFGVFVAFIFQSALRSMAYVGTCM